MESGMSGGSGASSEWFGASSREVVVPMGDAGFVTGMCDITAAEMERVNLASRAVRASNPNPVNPMIKDKQSIAKMVVQNLPTVPFFSWICNYKKSDFGADLVAGLLVAIMLVPQGMAYASLAGVPPQYGLYSSIMPPLIYALLGTSKELAVGPVAILSLMVSSGLSKYVTEGVSMEDYVQLTILLALMVGAIQTLMGLLKVGVLVNFFSHPMLKGVICAASLMVSFITGKYVTKKDTSKHPFTPYIPN